MVAGCRSYHCNTNFNNRGLQIRALASQGLSAPFQNLFVLGNHSGRQVASMQFASFADGSSAMSAMSRAPRSRCSLGSPHTHTHTPTYLRWRVCVCSIFLMDFESGFWIGLPHGVVSLKLPHISLLMALNVHLLLAVPQDHIVVQRHDAVGTGRFLHHFVRALLQKRERERSTPGKEMGPRCLHPEGQRRKRAWC